MTKKSLISFLDRPAPPRKPVLTFSPMAFLKLQYLCHAGPTKVAAFGLASPEDPLFLEDILVVRQQATAVIFAARTLGIDAQLYDGSFQDWSAKGLPVELPPAAAG